MDLKSIEFTKSLIDNHYDLSSYLSLFEKHVNVMHYDINVIDNICEFLNIETSYLYTTNTNQEIRTITFGELLLKAGEKNYHNDGEFKCKYHEESLLTHLILCMLKCIEILPIEMSTLKKTRLAITALFHDIGKVVCHLNIKKPKISVTAFPFHGECGSGIMMNLFTDNVNKFFNKNEWLIMCRSIAVHMCGYHTDEYSTSDAEYKMNLLKIECQEVKETLYWLMYGDETGKITSVVKPDNIMLLREKFKTSINGDFNTFKFFINNNINGCIIKLCGQSGSGKSTMSKIIVDYLVSNNINKNNILVIERDLIMANITTMEINPNAVLYVEKPRGQEYRDIYSKYKELKLGAKVNKTISNLIKNNVHKIIIVDSVINYYGVASQIYPDECKNMFKISINIIRGSLLDENDYIRMNMSMEQQLELFGNKNVVQWLPNGHIELNSLTSMSTNKYIHKSTVQPHLCYQYSWKHNFNLGIDSIFSSLNHVLEFLDPNIDICQFLNSFDNTNDIVMFFRNNKFLITFPHIFKDTEYENECFMIKYLEHNKNFSKQWMRHTRGSVFIRIDGKIKCIKNLLQRGIEYVTGCHKRYDIDNNETSNGLYDNEQQMIINKFDSKSDLNSILSFKNDGSLLGIILYPKSDTNLCDIISSALNNCPFSKMIMEKSAKYDFIPVFCSQGTLTISSQMMDYYITAIACGMFKMSYELMRQMSSTITPLEYMEQFIIDELLIRLNIFWNKCDILNRKTMCLSFECVNINRTSAWNIIHTELAVSYDKCSCKLLGCTFNVDNIHGIYRTHFQLDNICFESGFDEPLFWKIEHTQQICIMIEDISHIIKGQMSIHDYYTKYPYSNKYNNFDLSMDFEGFVLYVNVGGKKLGLGESELDYNVDYGKAKTIEYYKCHKLNVDNIQYLLSLPKEAENWLPMIKSVKIFYQNIKPNIINIMNNINIVFIDIINGVHELYLEQKKIIKQQKMINSFDKKDNIETKCLIIINTFIGFEELSYKIFNEFINIPNNKQSNIIIKKIICTIKPWLNNIETINNVLNNENIMNELFNIINQCV